MIIGDRQYSGRAASATAENMKIIVGPKWILFFAMLSWYRCCVKARFELKNFTVATLANIAVEEEDNLSLEQAFEAAAQEVFQLFNESSTTNYIDSANDTEAENPSDSSHNQNVITNPLYSMQELDGNATMWELVKAQIAADFAPFLILVPGPVKRFVKAEVTKLGKALSLVLVGAIKPMATSTSTILRIVGTLLVRLGNQFLEIENSISSGQSKELDNANDSHKSLQSLQMVIVDDCDRGSEDADVHEPFFDGSIVDEQSKESIDMGYGADGHHMVTDREAAAIEVTHMDGVDRNEYEHPVIEELVDNVHEDSKYEEERAFLHVYGVDATAPGDVDEEVIEI